MHENNKQPHLVAPHPLINDRRSLAVRDVSLLSPGFFKANSVSMSASSNKRNHEQLSKSSTPARLAQRLRRGW